MSTETIESPVSAIAEYSPTKAALAVLRARLANVAYDVSTLKGLDIAKKDRAEVRGLRVALEKKRVELKAPALERSRLIDAEAKALTDELESLETPIDDQIKAEERRKESEKAAREQAEREKVEAIQADITSIASMATLAFGKPHQIAQASLNVLAELEVTLDRFGDFAGQAAQVKAKTIQQLTELRDAGIAHAAEVERIAAEREDLVRRRAEQQARDKVERDRVAAEQAEQAAKLAAERKAFEQDQAKARAEAQAREDADRARRDEEDRKAREARAAEDKRIADARAAMEAEQRAAREAEEAKTAAARKVEQDAADAVAAAERKRLDDEAAALRAEQQARADELLAEAARFEAAAQANAKKKQQLYAAAPAMLEALQNLENDANQIPAHAWKLCQDAIALAIGESA